MDFLQPNSLAEALEIKTERPDAVPIQGGTDLMVDINFGRIRPAAILDLSHVPELKQIERNNSDLLIGSGVSYSTIMRKLAEDAPGLCMASRSVGSPQIRARGTLGGNLATASPAGDSLPMLVATKAIVEVASSTHGKRLIPILDFMIGPRKTSLRDDELITQIHVPKACGSQQFSKVGQRNAMVISVVSFALVFNDDSRDVSTGIGSAGPVIIEASEANKYVADIFDSKGLWDSAAPLPNGVAEQFGKLTSDAAKPIDDIRGTSQYRHHALAVIATRSLNWAWNEYCSTHKDGLSQ